MAIRIELTAVGPIGPKGDKGEPGIGDMEKIVYDTNVNGIVDKAESIDDGLEHIATAEDIMDAVSNKHSHSNKTELDKVTDGDHDVIVSGNPHQVTKSDVGLGNVTNDAQVKTSDLASQSEAETGTDDTKWMSPLKTKQAIDIGGFLKKDGSVSITDDWNIDGQDTLFIDRTNKRAGFGTNAPARQVEITKDIKIADTTSNILGVIYKGSVPFIHNFHHPTGQTAVPDGRNVFIGEYAGNFTMGSTATSTNHGSYNVGIGYQSLMSNEKGYLNVAIGDHSLKYNTNGYYNTAIGSYSMLYNQTGYNNLAIGSRALYYNISGNNNVGIGQGSLRSNTSGNTNTGIGRDTLYDNLTGGNNIAIGYASLKENTSGGSNIAIGYASLYYSNGNHNIAFGYWAGSYIADGSNLTKHYDSIFIGRSTKAKVDNGSNEIVIGYNAIGEGSNTIRLGNTSITGVFTSGIMKAGGYKSSDGSEGLSKIIEIIDHDNKKHTLTFKNGILTAHTYA